MGLLNKLQTDGSNLSEFDGTTPQTSVGATDQSVLHFQYSLFGQPDPGISAPQPSLLDLNGVTPPKYLDNPPQ